MHARGEFATIMSCNRLEPRNFGNYPLKGAVLMKERLRVLELRGRGLTVCRFGEPPQNAGHMLIYDPVWGVRALIAIEVWRCQFGMAGDPLYARYAKMHPGLGDEELAAAAGDSVASCYASAVGDRTTERLAHTIRALSAVCLVQSAVRRYSKKKEFRSTVVSASCL